MHTVRSFMLAAFILLAAFGPAAGETVAEPVAETTPQAVIAETTFEFPDALDGQKVTHDFIIKNQGATPLDIQNVKTG